MIDPDSIDPKDHITLQNDLIASNKFYVVDRANAYKAIKKEQEREHRDNQDRFEDKQKYAQWGKLYGVGGVIVAHLQCTDNPSTENVLWGIAHMATLGVFHNRRVCAQFLELVDTNTGEVVTSVRNDFKTDSEAYEMDWTGAVEKLADAYPKYFEEQKKHKILQQYEQETAERAQQQREVTSEGAK